MDTNAVYLSLGVCSMVSLLLIGLSIPLALGKIARNQWYGFRTKKTLADDVVWYRANRTAAVNLISAGIFILLTAGVVFAVKDSIPAKTSVVLMPIVTMAAILAAVVKSFMSLKKAALKI